MAKIGLLNVQNGQPRRDAVFLAAASGAITALSGGVLMITKGTAAVLTLAAPVESGLTLRIISTTAAAHTVTVSTTWGGLATTIGTFGAAIGNGITLVSYASKWWIVPGSNLNVTIS